MLDQIVIASLIVILAALGGTISFWRTIGTLIEKHLGLLVSFSAGLFLIVAYEMGRETIQHSPSAGVALLWILAGMFLVWLPFKLIPLFHHHHDKDCASDHSRIDTRRILLGNGLHNIGDGILLATAFSVTPDLGWAATLSVFIHELVLETSNFFVLKKGGFSTSNTLLANLLVSCTILIGALGGYFMLDHFYALETPLLGLSAGTFLIVVLIDLIPHSIHQSRKDKGYISHLSTFLLGFLLMFSLVSVFGHSHDQDPDHDHRDESSNDHDHPNDQPHDERPDDHLDPSKVNDRQ